MIEQKTQATQTTGGLNVDAHEIAKFEQLASRWWDKQSEFKPLHDINPLRLNYIDERAHLPGKKCWMWAAVVAYCLRAYVNEVRM